MALSLEMRVSAAGKKLASLRRQRGEVIFERLHHQQRAPVALLGRKQSAGDAIGDEPLAPTSDDAGLCHAAQQRFDANDLAKPDFRLRRPTVHSSARV